MVKKKKIKVSQTFLFSWFLLAGLILLFAPTNITSKFHAAFAHVFRYPLSVSRNISLSARVPNDGTEYVSREEYNQLQNHLANVIEQLEQEKLKVEKLSGIRTRSALEGAAIVLADIITANIDSMRAEFIINKGQEDGIKTGQYVIGDNSVIGTISEINSQTSRVKLISDLSSKIPIKIGKNQIDGILAGRGNAVAQIPLIPVKTNIREGDIVYARKKPGFLETPMVAGRVDRCTRDAENPMLWEIIVKPVCDIANLTNVAVIIMNPDG